MLSAWLPVAAYAALIFFLSSMPALSPPGGWDHVDKVIHLVEFGVMGALLSRALALSGVIHSGRRWVATVLLGSALAAGDEWWQGTVGRHTSLADWTMDTAGVVAAATLDVWRGRRQNRHRGLTRADA